MKVYGDVQSGNCYKVKMTLDFLQKEYEWIHVDILAGDTKTPEYLAKNDAGKIPLLALDDGRYLSESNAIINYLAHGSELIPTDVYDLACAQKWQFFEQYSHEPFIAVARYINKYLGLPEARQAEYESLQAGGYKALEVMERQLLKTPFLVNNSLSTADISLYAYTHVCSDGGFSLAGFPNIQSWLKRIEALPHYSKMA
jgi:glutathione S-transferase